MTVPVFLRRSNVIKTLHYGHFYERLTSLSKMWTFCGKCSQKIAELKLISLKQNLIAGFVTSVLTVTPSPAKIILRSTYKSTIWIMSVTSQNILVQKTKQTKKNHVRNEYLTVLQMCVFICPENQSAGIALHLAEAVGMQ